MFKCDHAVQCCSGNSCHCWHWLISNLPVWISASFERWMREPLGGSRGMPPSPPPPPARKFWNLGAQKCSCKHSPWHFSSEKSILGKCRSSLFLLLSDAGVKLMTICIFKHLKYRYSQFKWNKLTSLKCFSPQFIHLILAEFIATNLIFSRDYVLNKLNVSSKKKGQKEDEQLPRLASC